jgi:hypothetical protein
LSFWPRRAPEDNATFRFPVTYRGQMLDVEIASIKWNTHYVRADVS